MKLSVKQLTDIAMAAMANSSNELFVRHQIEMMVAAICDALLEEDIAAEIKELRAQIADIRNSIKP